MKLWRPKNFYESLLPAYIMRVIFGFNVIYYPWHKPRIILTIIYGLFTLFFNWWRFYMALTAIGTYWYNDVEAIYYYIMIFKNIQMGVCVISTWWRRKVDEQIALSLSAVEDTLQLLRIETDFTKFISSQLKAICVWIIACLAMNTLSATWNDFNKFGFFHQFFWVADMQFAVYANSYLEYNYFMSIRHFERRYQQINEYLMNLNVKKDKKKKKSRAFRINVAPIANRRDPKNTVQILKQIHLHLRRIAEDVTQVYSMQLTILMASSPLQITGLLYISYSHALSPVLPLTLKLKRVIVVLVAVIVDGLKVLLVNSKCATTISEYERTRDIIQKLGMMSDDSEFRREVTQFSHQIMSNSLTFEPYGLFQLGYEHILTYISTIATYSVIFIQNHKVTDDWKPKNETSASY